MANPERKPERDTVYTNDGNRTVYTRESSGTSWFVGFIVALALLAIGYLVFSANSGPKVEAGAVVVFNGGPKTIFRNPDGTCLYASTTTVTCPREGVITLNETEVQGATVLGSGRVSNGILYKLVDGRCVQYENEISYTAVCPAD